MFEYLITGAIVVGLLILFYQLLKHEKYFLVLLGLLFVTKIYGEYTTDRDIKENIESFKAGNNFICSSGGGLYNSANHYSVSKEEGWSIQKGYFKKDSILVRADMCKVE